MSFNRVYSPYPGTYVLKAYSEVEPASAAQRTLEVTPLVAKGVIEDYTFPETAEAGAEQSWTARVHNIGDTGIMALGIVNTTGNPGMASGGTGDVLTGVIAGLIGQKLTPFDAAVLGVYLHGLAGDLAAETFGSHGLTATDVLNSLAAAFRTHGSR